MSTLSAQVSLELREFTAKEKSEPTPTEVEDHHRYGVRREAARNRRQAATNTDRRAHFPKTSSVAYRPSRVASSYGYTMNDSEISRYVPMKKCRTIQRRYNPIQRVNTSQVLGEGY